MKTNGGEGIRLEARDWLWVMFTVAGAMIALGTFHFSTMNRIEGRIQDIDEKWYNRVEGIKTAWQQAAPSPALWTREAVARLEDRIKELEHEVKQMKRPP
jgi:hypothetical protein